AGAGGAPFREELTRGVELLHAIVRVFDHVEVSVPVDCGAERVEELPVPQLQWTTAVGIDASGVPRDLAEASPRQARIRTGRHVARRDGGGRRGAGGRARDGCGGRAHDLRGQLRERVRTELIVSHSIGWKWRRTGDLVADEVVR